MFNSRKTYMKARTNELVLAISGDMEDLRAKIIYETILSIFGKEMTICKNKL